MKQKTAKSKHIMNTFLKIVIKTALALLIVGQVHNLTAWDRGCFGGHQSFFEARRAQSAMSAMVAQGVTPGSLSHFAIESANFSITNRSGVTRVDGSLTVGSLSGSTTLGFDSRHSASGSVTRMYSEHTPSLSSSSISGFGAPQQDPSLWLHAMASSSIRTLTQLPEATTGISGAVVRTGLEVAKLAGRVEGVIKAGEIVSNVIARGQALLNEQPSDEANQSPSGEDPSSSMPGLDGKQPQWNPQKNHDKKALHERFGNFYRDPATKQWWTKDTAQHSGQSIGKEPSTWKVYEETGKGLRWLRDADSKGIEIVNKHKGSVGTEISWKDLIVKK